MQTEILGISGSLRKDSLNTALLHEATSLSPLPINIYPLDTLPLFNEDAEAKNSLPQAVASFREAITAHSYILLISPEYNWGIPGVVKNAIDWVSTNTVNLIKGKYIAIAGVSSGGFGTVRMQMQLQETLFHLGAHVMNTPYLFVSNGNKLFNEKYELTDMHTKQKLQEFLDAFAQFVM